MFFCKDIINIIEKYSNIKNIYDNSIDSNIKIEYKCDNCNSRFTNCNKKNKIIYELKDFNNNLLNSNIDKFKTMNLQELFLVNSLNYYNIKFKKVNNIFCNLCLFNLHKKSYDFDIYNKGIFEYISSEFYNYIKMNNNYFIKDKINNRKNVTIKRILFKNRDNDLYLKYININSNCLLSITSLSEHNYKVLNDIIFKDFNFDIEYIYNYIKIKYE